MDFRTALLVILIHKTEKYHWVRNDLMVFACLVLAVAAFSFDFPWAILPAGAYLVINGLRLMLTSFRDEFFHQRIEHALRALSPGGNLFMSIVGPFLDTVGNYIFLLIGLSLISWAISPYLDFFPLLSGLFVLVISVISAGLWWFVSFSGIWQQMHEMYHEPGQPKEDVPITLSSTSKFRIQALALANISVATLLVWSRFN